MTRKWLPLEQVEEYKTTIANKLKLEQLENMTIEINNCIANTLTETMELYIPAQYVRDKKLNRCTQNLIKQRKVMPNKRSEEYRKFNKRISTEIRKDIRTYDTNKTIQMPQNKTKVLKYLERRLI